MTKKYRIKTSCPQCGCSGVSHLSEDEIKKRIEDIAKNQDNFKNKNENETAV
ncbi:MAG: hypothetical protein HN597_20195, partial [Desulfobacula sp.]|nr:hypothetical protein [Desulfobacula sp.]